MAKKEKEYNIQQSIALGKTWSNADQLFNAAEDLREGKISVRLSYTETLVRNISVELWEWKPGMGKVWGPGKELEKVNLNEALKKFVYNGKERTRVIHDGGHRVWGGLSPIFEMIPSQKWKSLRHMVIGRNLFILFKDLTYLLEREKEQSGGRGREHLKQTPHAQSLMQGSLPKP